MIDKEDEFPEFKKSKINLFIKKSFDKDLGWIRKANTSGKEESYNKTSLFKIDKKGSRFNPNNNTKYKKKIVAAFTVESLEDVEKYRLYKNLADIYLFDSKGYHKSMSFEHTLVKDIEFNKEVMIAGNIQINDKLEKFKKIADIIDISGGVETSGLKDISKIEIFLNKIKQINNEA